MSKIIGAVEIGTSHAKVLIGEVGENKRLSIVGMASRSNEGMRKGEIIDFRSVATCVHSAIEEAEKMSGTTIDSIYLCLLYTSPSPRDATLSRMPSSA